MSYFRYSFLCWLLTLACLRAGAQSESDERAMVSVSKGISFAQDSSFLLNMRLRMQNRIGARSNSLTDLSIQDWDARIRRLRLRFDGFVGSPKLQYYIQLSFSRADQDLDNSDDPKTVRDAIIYYHFSPQFYMALGQAKLPGNRQRVVSSGNMQLADRSIANAAFTLERDFGLFAYYNTALGKSALHLKGAVSTGEGRDVTRTDQGLAYTLRAEWLPWGEFAGNGDYSEGDLEFEQQPRLSLAATYSRNEETRQSGGQIGRSLAQGIDLDTWFADAMFKYRGHACLFEWMHRRSDVLLAPDASGNSIGIPAGTGLNLQYSYTLRNYWEPVLRYSRVQMVAGSPLSHQREVLLGVNKYLNKHRIKVQAHTGYQSNISAAARRERLVAMFQVEFGI